MYLCSHLPAEDQLDGSKSSEMADTINNASQSFVCNLYGAS